MPSLTISLSLKSRLRSSTRGDSYGVLSFDPSLVFDFKNNYFRKSATNSTFGASITHAATTNATMVDSDGLLKWRPHNLLSNSSVLGYSKLHTATSTSTVVSPSGLQDAVLVQPTVASGVTWVYDLTVYNTGAVTTISTFAKASGKSFVTMSNSSANLRYASFNLTTGAVGTVASGYTANIEDFGNGWYRCSVTTPTGFNNRAVYAVSDTDNAVAAAANGNDGILLWGAQLNRSDLGGMVNNPDRGDSYVPTTTSAVYLSRRGHHIYNGSAWVNEGILHESEARTNQMAYSGDVTGTGWSAQGDGGSNAGTLTAGGPFGTYQTVTPSATDSSYSAQRYQIGKSITSGQTYVSSALLKYSAGSFWAVVSVYDTVTDNKRAWFDLQNGVVGTKDASVLDHGMIDYGDGWWLCWASANSGGTSGGFNIEIVNGDGVLGRKIGDVMLVAGSQFELGSTPSSYIPTTSATVTRAAETLTVPAASLPYDSTNMSIQMDGKMTYADTGISSEVEYYRWLLNGTNYINSTVQAYSSKTGEPVFSQRDSATALDSVVGSGNTYSPNTNVPFNFAVRHGSTFINAANEGTLLTANTTPTALPNLSSNDLTLGFDFMGTIGEFRMWSDDLGDVGITEATIPSTEPSLSLTFDGSETSFIVLDWSE